jgi:glycerol-3-phosphate acyltransferase PlsY
LANLYLLLAGVIGYFCGAIPFGYLYVKATKGINILEVGSGRTGGTNSYRAAGLGTGVITALSDVLKGFVAVWLARYLLAPQLGDQWLPWLSVVAGVSAIIGHNWSIFLGWRGGAGTGPNVGWATAVWWPLFPISWLLMFVFLIGVGMASVASLAMAAVIPVAFLILYALGVPGYDDTIAYIVGGLAAAAVVAWALRPNIKRLLAGNESMVGPRARALERKRQPKANV